MTTTWEQAVAAGEDEDDGDLVVVTFKLRARHLGLLDKQAKEGHRNRSAQCRRYTLWGLERDGVE